MSSFSYPQPPSELSLYLRVLVVSALIFGGFYAYTTWLQIPNVLNKTAADTSIFLMGMSMLMSSIGYFGKRLDSWVRYRKHLGLVGFAFGLAHWFLSWGAFQNLLKAETWQKGAMWPALTGLLALGIFTVMALISNSQAARLLGGKWWRFILRSGYLAVILVWLHVVLLKSGRWVTWYENGMKTLPSLSLLVTVFMTVVLVMRVVLWIATRRKQPGI